MFSGRENRQRQRKEGEGGGGGGRTRRAEFARQGHVYNAGEK